MTEVQRLVKIKLLKELLQEYELRAKYNTESRDYDLYSALDWAIEALEQEPCEDTISRQATVERLCKVAEFMNEKRNGLGSPYVMAALFIQDNKDEFPSVTPAPKMGHWIKTPKAVMGEGYMWYCDKCEYQVYQDSSRPYPSENYCPNCGSYNGGGTKMSEIPTGSGKPNK